MAKHIAVGVTGSIAAYKACELVRLFSKEGYEVSVVMTAAAARFVTALTFRTLSRNPVCTGLFDDVGEWIPDHISIADRCDALVIAPCTANVLAKLAHGLADDALTATALACGIASQVPGSDAVIPLNAVTALIGAPIVITVLLRSRRGLQP